jgi:hypothetical protein
MNREKTINEKEKSHIKRGFSPILETHLENNSIILQKPQ